MGLGGPPAAGGMPPPGPPQAYGAPPGTMAPPVQKRVYPGVPGMGPVRKISHRLLGTSQASFRLFCSGWTLSQNDFVEALAATALGFEERGSICSQSGRSVLAALLCVALRQEPSQFSICYTPSACPHLF